MDDGYTILSCNLVPGTIQHALNAEDSYREGFRNIFRHIGDCTEAGEVLTAGNVLKTSTSGSRQLGRETRQYLIFGGTVQGNIEPALAILLT